MTLAWGGHRNGHIPAGSLRPVGAGHLLAPAAAADFTAWSATFAARFGRRIALTSSYRSYAGQVESKRRYGSYAAIPGTSVHGWGKAIDINRDIAREGSETHAWLVRNGPTFGWHWPEWASNWDPRDGEHEPWHFEHPSDYPVYRAGADSKSEKLTRKVPKMLILQRDFDGIAALLRSDGSWSLIHSANALTSLTAASVPVAIVDDKTFADATPAHRKLVA